MKEWAEAFMGIGIAACICALLGFFLLNLRECDAQGDRYRIEQSKVEVEHQKAIAPAMEACRVACAEHGVHRVEAHKCECK